MAATQITKFPISSTTFTNHPASIPRTLIRSREFRNWVPHSHGIPNLTRRLFLPSVSGIWDAITGGGGGDRSREASLAVRRGMLLFRQGDVLGSVAEFDKAIELDPRQKAYMWQRGLSLYYLDRFEEGAEQFRIDVAMNPNDTEESIWCFLCEAQLLQVGRDSRPVMREAYNMFRDGGDPEKLVAAFSNGGPNEYFYASLYAGLYHESQVIYPSTNLCICILNILQPIGYQKNDYMASLAKVHCQCRNWSID
ncbi:hypothetical protein LINPERPRIM_LOCUS1690 [Linum perenne]